MRFVNWLLTPVKTFHEKAANIVIGLVLMILWNSAILKLYSWLLEKQVMFPFFPFHQISIYKHPFWLELFIACILAPLWEEVIFRHTPLQIVKSTNKKELYLPVILGSSIIFGIGHPLGVLSIPVQGVGGFIMCCVYMKNGFSYWSSVILHFTWNFGLLIGFINV